MKVIAEEFMSYINAIFPNQEEVDATQIIETRRAFMAGARAMFTLTCNATELPESEAFAKLTEFEKEFDEFVKMVQAGVA